MDVAKMVNLDAPNMQNFIVLKVLPKLHHEFSFESIDAKEIVELLIHNLTHKLNPPMKKWKSSSNDQGKKKQTFNGNIRKS